ncbi:MAG: polysaccharide deacetylase family protein [Treponema sp.]|nr:polysaccharide deacetylase family protein [Treponema sp.]
MKARQKLKIIFLVFFIMPAFNLWGINFTGLNVSHDDKFLFKADFESRHALFVTRLSDMSIKQLTAFPEKMYLTENGRTIITLCKFGAVRIPVSGGLPSPLPGYPSFSEGGIPLKGNLQDIAASADGRWIIHIDPTSHGYGNLLLIDILSGAKRVISERVELPGAEFPVKWSPDSRLFVYEKGGRLFYFPILSDLSALVDERFRMIGSGGITSVLWGQHGDFYYLTGNTLYRVTNPELFTRTIYGDFLSIGRIAAVLPFHFDSGFDHFWIAPDSLSVLINKGGRGLFVFTLGESRNSAAPLPHMPVPFGAENFNVLWHSSGLLTAVYSLQGETRVWRFEAGADTVKSPAAVNAPSSPNAALSPDGTRAVFWGENGLELWDYINWRLIQRLGSEAVLSCTWINNRLLIAGNINYIEEINIANPSYPRRVICISSAAEFGFSENTSRESQILVKAGNEWFASDGRSAWTAVSNARLQRASLSSDRFRVFLDPQVSGHFKNIPMIRSMHSTGTISLVSRHSANNSFTLGRPVQMALCFDLYDDDTGLQQVLAALRSRNIRATFFMNGEFIRRNPQAAAVIANAGHETASLFYAPVDLSDTRYRITREFIAAGLARNEDEFHRATGKELSILWHPPFYSSSGMVNAAAAAAGYITVERNIDPGDYISREDALRHHLRQVPSAEMIEQITRRRGNGAVVPIRLGLLPGGRDEYLFQRIDVLLDALLRSGYEIVPVSAVVR